MKIFDRRVPIHETGEGLPPMGDLIEHLDNMLCQYDVGHAFAYPSDDAHKGAAEESGKELMYWLYYDAEQNTELTLILGLFLKIHLKKDSAKILAAISQSIVEEAA